MHVVLVEPQIAPNTGSLVRLCANVGIDLHLVEPLGFEIDDAKFKRGGLDYHDLASLSVHPSLDHVRSELGGTWYAFSAKASRRYTEVAYKHDDVVVFGTERTGLSESVLATFPADRRLHIPMRPGNRSLNLANAVSIVVYEAWRQAGFDGAQLRGGADTIESIASPR